MDEIDPKRIIEEPEIPRKTAVILMIAGGAIVVLLGMALWSSSHSADPLFPGTAPSAETATR